MNYEFKITGSQNELRIWNYGIKLRITNLKHGVQLRITNLKLRGSITDFKLQGEEDLFYSFLFDRQLNFAKNSAKFFQFME